MSTLFYTPGVRAHIETTSNGLIDISSDLVSGTLDLRENAPHVFSFKLQNTQRKYDGMLLPMDKISVQFKRLNWLQCFTGYLNDPPIFQAWPGTLDMTATCTLKIPQFFTWDPSSVAVQTLVIKALGKKATVSGSKGDVDMQSLVRDTMSQVLGWHQDRIHIGQIPKNWFNWTNKVLKKIGADEAIYNKLNTSFMAAGTNGVTSNLPAGSYGGATLSTAQAANASIVYSTVMGMGVTNDFIPIMTFMCAMAESSFQNYANESVPGSMALPHDAVGSDHASVGVFQQQVGMGWGTVGECQDVAHATKTFVTRLLAKVTGTPQPSEFGLNVQSVQISGTSDGSNYQKFLDQCTAMVAKIKGTAGAVASTTPSVNKQDVGAASGTNKATGSQIGAVALQLIEHNKTSPITYMMGGDDKYSTPIAQVKTLDCSSLVDWVYYNATTPNTPFVEGRGDVASQRPLCKLITVKAAGEIQGAVLINGTEHIGVSLGNGTTHVAAHGPDGTKSIDISDIGTQFSDGGLLPLVDYAGSATTAAAKTALDAAGVKTTGLATQLTAATDGTAASAVNDPLAVLINNVVLNTNTVDTTTAGNALNGYVTLINDVTFLPWLQSIMNSSMRSFCSAPNGDFIAWFPDYFGAWGSAGIMDIEQIELQDFQVTWSDQNIVTHQFVIGSQGATMFDIPSADISATVAVDTLVAIAQKTLGVATMDYPEIFQTIYGDTAPSGFTKAFLKRFGARVDYMQMPNVPRGAAEFFMALYHFTLRWAGQFTASVPMTFMPELWPGMLLRVPSFGFQAYIQGVSHSFSFGQGGGFTTTASICAPSNTGTASRTDLLSLLPLASAPV